MTVKYIATVGLEASAPFPTFRDAFIDFFARAKIFVASGPTLASIESSCWIRGEGLASRFYEHGETVTHYFSDARDIAHIVGLLNRHGELVPDAPLDTDWVDSHFRDFIQKNRAPRRAL